MKRRNVEIGKMRRPMKRNKITDGFYGSTLLYVRFLVLWLLVILADFILEFRFEFLWPFYLLIRSVYDSFKYQGLAFSIFFVCIALTSDMLCFFFIPVHWLFFAASTYVWVQYVWHTDKGICAPTIILWMLFVYLEAAVRLRDVKHMPGHLDLCRPFAAHCIGYPVVTLGFGFKSYVGYRIRQRKQRDVAKENEFYMQLMQQALPHEILQQQHHNSDLIVVQNNNTTTITNKIHNSNNSNIREKNGHLPNGSIPNGHTKSHRRLLDKCKNHDDHHNNTLDKSKFNHSHSNGNVVNFEDDVYNSTATLINNNVSSTIPTTTTTSSSSSSSSSIVTNSTLNHLQSQSSSLVHHSLNSTTLLPSSTNNVNVTSYSSSTKKREKREQDIKEKEAAEYLQKLEIDAKKLRIDLQNSRASEQELRLQVATLTTSEKVSKGELTDMQREIEELQQRIQNLISSRASDKQTINNLERRMADERRIRCNLESQLNQERKNRKEDARVAAQAAAQSARNECTENCKLRRRELEKDLQECRQATHIALERCSVLEREKGQMVEKLRDKDLLMSALTALQEKNSHLENSLSAETRIKLDLFSALGEAKRQIEIRECSNRTQEKEIEELKSKIAQVLAVMPNDTFGGATQLSRVRLSDTTPGSTLDPNATAYTPKGSLVASTEA